MKLISWNDSLNAALTSDSYSAKLSQEVLQTLVAEDGYHCHSRNQVIRQRTYQKTPWNPWGTLPSWKHLALFSRTACKGSLEPCSYKRAQFRCDFPRDRALDHGLGRSDHYLEFDISVIRYTPNAGDGLKRLEERQVWDVKYAEYLAELDKENLSLATGDQTLLTRKSTCQPSQNRCSPGLQTKNVKDLQIFGQRIYRYLPPCPWWCAGSVTLGGHNVARHQNQQHRLENRLLVDLKPHCWQGHQIRWLTQALVKIIHQLY